MQVSCTYTDERFPSRQIRWHGGATFAVWVEGSSPHLHSEDGWTELDAFTRYGDGGRGEAPNDTEARQAAKDHFDRLADEASS